MIDQLDTLPVLPAAGEVGILRRLCHTPAILDTEGRPLCEGHALGGYRHEAPLEYATCPYHDSRRQHPRPMNASALAQVTEHWDDLLGVLTWLVDAHGALPQLGPHTDAVAFYQRVSLMFAVPLCAAIARPGSRIHPAIASAWKASLGFQPVAQRLVIDSLFAEPAAVSGDDIYRLAVRDGALVGRREVCAGSPRMIAAAADVLLGRARVTSERAVADTLGRDWTHVAATYSNHWLYDTGVLLVATMLGEDLAPPAERRFPTAGEDRQLLVEALRDASIATPDAEPVWGALLAVVARGDEPRERLQCLDAIQHEALARMEASLRTELALPPLPRAVLDSLCFVDLSTGAIDRHAPAHQLRGLADAMQLEPRIGDQLVAIARAIEAGTSLQPAAKTAQLVSAYVRFARDVARIEGAPVQLEASEVLAAHAAATLGALAGMIPFAPTRALVEALATELATGALDPHVQAFPGDAAAWLGRLDRFVNRRDLRVLALLEPGAVARWMSDHVATHPTAQIDRALGDPAYGIAIVGGPEDACAAWPRVREDGVLIVVGPRDATDVVPFRPPGGAVERVGGAWFVQRASSTVGSRAGFVLRGSHGDNPLVGLRFAVES